MKIELKNNKIFFENQGRKKEIHPFWFRERVNGESFIDEATQQSLFDPTKLEEDIQNFEQGSVSQKDVDKLEQMKVDCKKIEHGRSKLKEDKKRK